MTPPSSGLALRSWRDRAVVGAALMAMAAGFGQFGVVAALGDVAKVFGHRAPGNTFIAQAGLTATQLGVGLAILRLASLGGLPLSGLADRFGRRTVLLWTCALGLAFTVLAAASPGYWWFIVIYALGRPLLSATNAVASVVAAESTGARDRAKAVALVVAGYAVGTGLTVLVHGWFGNAVGFRGILLLSAVPLTAIVFIRRLLVEPDRFTVSMGIVRHPVPVLGAVEKQFRQRLLVVGLLAFAVSVVTGPANSLIFVYAENVLHLSDATTASMVIVASVVGLGGLLFGRWLADRIGRRPTGAGAMVAMALCAVLTYSGSRNALFVGYELAVFSASTFAPGAGAFVNELFPTSVRASATGWYVAAGVLGAVVGLIAFAEVGAHADSLRAAMVTFLPVVAASALFALLPETVGREPEDLWPQEK